MPYQSGREAFMQGVRALIPLSPGVVPFGLLTGVMAINMGLSPGTTMGMTLLFYSGSAQMVALQLLHTGVVPLAIVVTALVINLRFIMYSASLAPICTTCPGAGRGRCPTCFLTSPTHCSVSSFPLANWVNSLTTTMPAPPLPCG